MMFKTNMQTKMLLQLNEAATVIIRALQPESTVIGQAHIKQSNHTFQQQNSAKEVLRNHIAAT